MKTPVRFFLGRLWPSDSPRVFYGFERIPSRDETASGGIIKLQDLAEVYPNSRWLANTLYLVSSCYPWTVRWQVRVARLFGARVVLNQNGVAYPAWKPVGWEEENERAAWVHTRADAVIYQSEFCKRCALQWLAVQESAESCVLLNPVDLDAFSAPPESFPKGERSFRILLAGSHQFGYRVRVALETLAQLEENFRLTVCGAYIWSDSEEDALKEAEGWAESLGVQDRVEFRGRYSQSEAPDLFRSANLLLHTKVMDPCPRLVAEALASGLPVVYALSGGLPEMVSGDAGIGVDSSENFDVETPADPKDFAQAIRQVCANYSQFQNGARRCAETKFDSRPWLEAHGRVFAAAKKGSEQ